ncbi:reverse transcriptase domain-containing protein [Tanacetum coccineum]
MIGYLSTVEAPMPFPSEEEVERLLALPPTTTIILIALSHPCQRNALLEPHHHPLHPSPPLPPPPSSLHLPPHVPTSLPLPSSTLPPLPSHYSITPSPVDHREDIPEAELPPRKRLCLTALTSRYEVGESSTAAPRPTGGHRADYRFIGTMDAEIRRQRAEEVGYGIRDVWVDPTEAVEEVAPTTLEGVNARVTELAAVQEQDTQDIYVVIEDGQDRQTQLFQRVDGLVEDRQFHYETARLLDQEALVSREAWAHSVGLSSAVHYELQAYRTHTQMQDYRIASQESLMTTLITHVSIVYRAVNNIPPRRSSATARAATARAAVAAAATPMTAAAVEQLIEARVSAALANHETLRNSTNGHGDGSHNSDTGIRGTMESMFHISNCVVENQVKFATCTFLGNALTWWNSHMKTVTQDVAYAMDWKALKKMMTVKYCPRGEIKKLEIELWNLKGNVMSYQPKTMEKAIKFANDQMDKKVLTITERQAEQKRKLEFNAGNNQGHQQQNKRQNTGRAYTAGPGEKREYTGSLPLCTKCNYHHKGPCAPRCNKCKKIGHLARDCRSSGPNGALQERLLEAEERKS